MEYKNIFLTSRDVEILEMARVGAIVNVHPVEAAHMLSLGLIEHYALKDNEYLYVITSEGVRYHEYLHQQQADKKTEIKRGNTMFIITIIVSALSFIVSFVALLRK